jgi:hypothetical protein
MEFCISFTIIAWYKIATRDDHVVKLPWLRILSNTSTQTDQVQNCPE